MSDLRPLISVIVTGYNIGEYAERCVNSIMAQTYDNLQIILVDDGSTDSTGSIFDRLCENDGRLEVIHKKNGGPSDARNEGMERARGEYIGFVDGDDWIEPFMYEKMSDSILAYNADIAICRYNQINGDPDWEEPDGKTVQLTQDEAWDCYIREDRQHVIYNSVWNRLYCREVIGNIRFVKGKLSEDIPFTTETFCNAARFVYLDIPCYNYVCNRSDSIMNDTLSRRRIYDEIPFWRMQIKRLKKNGKHELAEKDAYFFYRRMLFYYIDFEKSGQKEYAREIAAQMEADRENINAVYHKIDVSAGDRARMNLFLLCPSLYAWVSGIYERSIVPIRQKKKTDE